MVKDSSGSKGQCSSWVQRWVDVDDSSVLAFKKSMNVMFWVLPTKLYARLFLISSLLINMHKTPSRCSVFYSCGALAAASLPPSLILSQAISIAPCLAVFGAFALYPFLSNHVEGPPQTDRLTPIRRRKRSSTEFFSLSVQENTRAVAAQKQNTKSV